MTDDNYIALYTAEQTRELDRLAMQQAGVTSLTLMKLAGSVVFDRLIKTWPSARKILIVCGCGNNGGDGYVIAKLAHLHGLSVQVIQLGLPEQQKIDAFMAFQEMQEEGVSTLSFKETVVDQADVVVDAIFGTGLARDITGDALQVIRLINQMQTAVIAVDIPSGLNADTGAIMGDVINADITVSFIGRNQGLYTADAKENCGEIYFDRLNIADDVYNHVPIETILMPHKIDSPLLAPRALNSHKGDFGHVLIVGGAPGMSGAVILAANAALYSGCGLVSVATHEQHAALISVNRPEIMSHAVSDNDQLERLMKRADVIVLGPGLGQVNWSRQLFDKVIESRKPLIIDADGLNLLSQSTIASNALKKSNNWILTPHPGEAARLLNESTSTIQRDRFSSAKSIQKKYGGICILKGAGSLVSTENQISICQKGNPGMAVAGMGDVLSGVLGSALAQSIKLNSADLTLVENYRAAKFAVQLHSAAADSCVQLQGEKALLASDLFPVLRRMINGR